MALSFSPSTTFNEEWESAKSFSELIEVNRKYMKQRNWSSYQLGEILIKPADLSSILRLYDFGMLITGCQPFTQTTDRWLKPYVSFILKSDMQVQQFMINLQQTPGLVVIVESVNKELSNDTQRVDVVKYRQNGKPKFSSITDSHGNVFKESLFQLNSLKPNSVFFHLDVTTNTWENQLDIPIFLAQIAEKAGLHDARMFSRAMKTPSAESIIQELKTPSPANQHLQPTKIILITDIERDVDDAVLLIILAWLHKIHVVEVELVVTNVKPSIDRARGARFVLDTIGALNVPVTYGTDGTDEEIEILAHELQVDWEYQPHKAKDCLLKTLKALQSQKNKCCIINTSSFRDLSELIRDNESLVNDTVSSVFLQGGWEEDKETQSVKVLVPDLMSRNNSYDSAAAIHVHTWLRKGIIPAYLATKHAALKAPISSKVFRDAAATNHPIAKYIYDFFGAQERRFYDQAAQDDPARRFKPHMDKKWYTMRTSWPYKDKLPRTFEEVQPFIQMILYDVVAGLICPFLEYHFFEQIYQPHGMNIILKDRKVEHYIVGRFIDGPEKAVLPDVDAELLSSVIEGLLVEALSNSSS